jgi:hypothetical protein
MSRTLFLRLDEGKVVAECLKRKIGISAIERLPAGGVRLVCMSSDGADKIRRALKSELLGEEKVARERHRPSTPLW